VEQIVTIVIKYKFPVPDSLVSIFEMMLINSFQKHFINFSGFISTKKGKERWKVLLAPCGF
jgi:hypothetical protein